LKHPHLFLYSFSTSEFIYLKAANIVNYNDDSFKGKEVTTIALIESLAEQLIAFAKEDIPMKHPRKYPMVLRLLQVTRARDNKRCRLKEAIGANMTTPVKVLV